LNTGVVFTENENTMLNMQDVMIYFHSTQHSIRSWIAARFILGAAHLKLLMSVGFLLRSTN